MNASANGDAEQPGQNVCQKSGLNRSILNQGWSMFKTQLTYKLKARGVVCFCSAAVYEPEMQR